MATAIMLKAKFVTHIGLLISLENGETSRQWTFD